MPAVTRADKGIVMRVTRVSMGLMLSIMTMTPTRVTAEVMIEL